MVVIVIVAILAVVDVMGLQPSVVTAQVNVQHCCASQVMAPQVGENPVDHSGLGNVPATSVGVPAAFGGWFFVSSELRC